jgi:hypothetical protein
MAGANRAISDLPGPPRLSLIGNAHKLVDSSRTHLVAEEWCRRYGPIYRIAIGRRSMVAIGDAEAINEILRERPHGFRRPANQQAVIGEMGGKDGIFIAEGELAAAAAANSHRAQCQPPASLLRGRAHRHRAAPPPSSGGGHG